MKNIIIVSLLALTACGGEDKFLWGDATLAISEAHCAAQVACGFIYSDTEKYLDYCVKHNQDHLCTYDGTCGVPVGDAVEDLTNTCVAELSDGSFSCIELYWGILPPSCYDLLDADPSETK